MPGSNVQKIVKADFRNTIEEKYLAYALSTITSRSLPDARDGLKPVHRRLLFAMHQLKLDPKSAYKKCARIVGDVIGKFHPHGEASVYDALVRMAQVFAYRYPVVDGQGNFGSIDGDAQAAMRYTEAKLTHYAQYLLVGIGEETVSFKSNYDDSDHEPEILPALVPNLLANGSEGIAVGMATNIPPHNLLELLEAAQVLLREGESNLSALSSIIKGPDFPTGGEILVSSSDLDNLLQVGKASFILRAKWHKEELKGGKYRIVVTEIPYQITKKNIVEQLAELYNDKKIPFIETFQDNSDAQIRLCIYPKTRDLDPNAIMQQLYKMTDLQIKYSANMNALTPTGAPKVMGVVELLRIYVDHALDVTKKRINFELGKLGTRLDVLHAMMVAFLNLDEVIRIIREEDEPKPILMERFSLSDFQAEAILNTKLRSLRKIEETQIKSEQTELLKRKAANEKILSSDANLKAYFSTQIEKIKKELAGDTNYLRKSEILLTEEIVTYEMPKIDLPKESITVAISKLSWIKSYKGHCIDRVKKPDDEDVQYFEMYSDGKLLLFSNSGKVYTVIVAKLSASRKEGDHISTLVDLADGEKIVLCYPFESETKFLAVASSGKGFMVTSEALESFTKAGKQVLSLDKDGVSYFFKLQNEQFLLLMGENRRMIALRVADIPEMKKGKGVALQKLKHGVLKGVKLFADETTMASSLPKGLEKPQLWIAARGGLGRLVLSKTIFDQ